MQKILVVEDEMIIAAKISMHLKHLGYEVAGMVPRGEVGLIFADIGRRAGLLSEEMFGAVLLMVMATTFVAPPVLKALFGREPA